MDIILKSENNQEEYLIYTDSEYTETTVCKFFDDAYGNCLVDHDCKEDGMECVTITVVDDTVIRRADDLFVDYKDITDKEEGEEIMKWYKVWQEDEDLPNPYYFKSYAYGEQIEVSKKGENEYKIECLYAYVKDKCGITGGNIHGTLILDDTDQNSEFIKEHGIEPDRRGEYVLSLDKLEQIGNSLKRKEKIEKVLTDI